MSERCGRCGHGQVDASVEVLQDHDHVVALLCRLCVLDFHTFMACLAAPTAAATFDSTDFDVVGLDHPLDCNCQMCDPELHIAIRAEAQEERTAS